MRLRYGDEFRRLDAGDPLWRDASGSATSRVTLHPAGHVLGSAQIAVECGGLRIVASGDYKDARDPTCAPFETGRLRRVHHRGDLRPAGVSPSATRRTRSPSCWRRSRCFRSARIWSGAYSLGKAQRVIALLREAGYDAPIYLHGAMEKITHYYAATRHRARRAASGEGRQEGRARRHHHAGAAVGHLGSLDAALSRSGHRVRLGLDAGARAGPAARRRTAAGDFRSRRLGRADRAPSRPPAPARSGSPTARKTRWCIGARRKGLTARPLDLVGYGDEDGDEALAAAEDAAS